MESWATDRSQGQMIRDPRFLDCFSQNKLRLDGPPLALVEGIINFD
jgi:hypothetical protein